MKTLKKSKKGGTQEGRPDFGNFSNEEQMSIDQMAEHLNSLTENRLVNLAGDLCALEDGELQHFRKHQELFA